MRRGDKITAGPKLRQVTNIDDQCVGRRVNLQSLALVMRAQPQATDGVREQQREGVSIFVGVNSKTGIPVVRRIVHCVMLVRGWWKCARKSPTFTFIIRAMRPSSR